MSLYPGFNKEKETSFSTLCMAKFGWTATSLFEIWTPAWSSDMTSLIYKGNFLFSLQNGTLSFFFGPFFSFFFFFFTKDFFPLLIFPLAKIFPQAKSFYE